MTDEMNTELYQCYLDSCKEMNVTDIKSFHEFTYGNSVAIEEKKKKEQNKILRWVQSIPSKKIVFFKIGLVLMLALLLKTWFFTDVDENSKGIYFVFPALLILTAGSYFVYKILEDDEEAERSSTLDTLAAIYAENGQFNEAVKIQKEAIEKLTTLSLPLSVRTTKRTSFAP